MPTMQEVCDVARIPLSDYEVRRCYHSGGWNVWSNPVLLRCRLNDGMASLLSRVG